MMPEAPASSGGGPTVIITVALRSKGTLGAFGSRLRFTYVDLLPENVSH